MKKVVIFYIAYESKTNKGHRMVTQPYSIFTRKSTIIDNFFNWQVNQLNLLEEELKEPAYVTNLKLIGV